MMAEAAQADVSSRDEPAARRLSLGDLNVDLVAYRASLGERVLELSVTQIEVLAVLLDNPERVISRAELSAAVGLRRGRSVDVILSRIRKEVGRDFIRNVRSRGWVVDPASLTPQTG